MDQYEHYILEDTLPKAYHVALWKLEHAGNIYPCPSYGTRCKEVSLTMEVGHPLKEPMISRCIPCGPEMLKEYELEMLDGIKDFAVERGRWSYTYHERIAPQLPRIIEMLERDRNTRHAFIDVRREGDLYLDHPPCLTSIQYFIHQTREHPEGQLNCKVVFRSNDAVKACFMNAYALIRLQERVAGELGVSVGTYTHRANSFHAYERDWDVLEKYAAAVDRNKVVQRRELTYSYEDDWKEQMDNAVPDIMSKVKKLKEEMR